jgi:hypothetical protein
MNLKDLMAISGYPGLFRFISQGRNSIIVESLEDKKRMSAYSTSKISTLEEIAVFTETGELPLADVFKRMYSHAEGKEVLSHKSTNKEIQKFFEEVLPEYDRERVYVSDMKKILHWYNLLIEYDMLHPEEEDKSKGKDDPADETGDDDKTRTAEDKNQGNPAGRKAEGYMHKKTEGHSGKAGRSSRNQPGKSVRQPRKT